MNLDPLLLPIHPPFVHFPMALFAVAWGLLVFGYVSGNLIWNERARLFELFGVASLPLVFATALIDTRGIEFVIKPRWDAPLIWHALSALVGAGLFVLHFFLSRDKTKNLSLAWDLGLPTLGLWVLLATGLIAAEMIYGQ